MSNWKKLVFSGSQADLSTLQVSESFSHQVYASTARLHNVAIFSASGQLVDTLHTTASIVGDSNTLGNSRLAANNIEFGMYAWNFSESFDGGGYFAKMSVEGVGRRASFSGDDIELLSIKAPHTGSTWGVIRNSDGATGDAGFLVQADGSNAELRIRANATGWSNQEFRIAQLDTTGRATIANYAKDGTSNNLDLAVMSSESIIRFFHGNSDTNPFLTASLLLRSGSLDSATSFRSSDGTEQTPAFSFTGEIDKGFFSPERTSIGVSLAGTEEFRFLQNGTDGEFHATGEIIGFSGTPSDRRLKKNIRPISGSLETLKTLEPVTFNWTKKLNRDTRAYGLIAQDVEKVLPLAVRETINLKMKDNRKYKIIDYTSLIPILIQGIKEQQNLLENLGERVEQLEKLLSSN